MLRYTSSLFASLLVLFPITGTSSELFLAKERKPVAQIELGAKATSAEQYAAEELQRAVMKISGAELPIKKEGEVDKGTPSIVIGTPDSSAKAKSAAAKLGVTGANEEEVAVWRDGETLYLIGPTPRAALYATYTFLQDTLGVRWFWPGDEGEYFPQKAEIAVGDLKICETPTIKYRGVAVTSVQHGYMDSTDVWMARNRMNTAGGGPKTPADISEKRKQRGFLIRIAGHNVKLPKELLEKHPEYAAEFGGKRRIDTLVPPQLCWSNPAVVDLIAEEIGSWWDNNPLADFVAPYSADNTHFCECGPCKEMGDVSTRWQKFSQQVIEKIEKKHPGKQYMTLAYQAYRSVPKGELAPWVSNGYCLYNGCYRHTYADDCQANPEALKELKEWQAKGGKMGIRGYEMIMFKESMFTPMTSFMVDQVDWSRKNEVVSIMTESSPYGHPKGTAPEDQRWASNRMTYYATAQAMWNGDLTTKSIVDDWTKHLYGPAAEPMNAYYFMMEKAWRGAKGHVTYFLNPAAGYVDGFITDDLIAKGDGLFAEAREKVKTIDDAQAQQRALNEVNFEGRLFEKWKELYRAREGRAAHFQAYALKAGEKPSLSGDPNETVWKNAPRLPAFEDKNAAKVKDQTDVYILWDDESLYLRFVCHDSSGQPLKTLFSNRDEAIYGDDSVEIFFNPDPSKPGYAHLAVNSIGTVWDARSNAGMNLDKGWNGDWKTNAKIGQGGEWIVDVALPYSVFGITAKEGDDLHLNFKRNRPGRRPDYPPSGWPDASYHNPSGYGKIRLVKELPKPLAVYSGQIKSDALIAALQKGQLQPVRVQGEKALHHLLAQGVRGVILRYPWGKGERLPEQFLQNEVNAYLQGGGRILITSKGEIPLQTWFPEADAAVYWSDEPINPIRKAVSVESGEWLMKPNDLRPIFKRGTTPRHGYRPLSSGWEVLAQFRLNDGGEAPFLLRKPIGKGMLYLTSSVLGFSGRHEIFGDSNTGNVAKLVENLFAN